MEKKIESMRRFGRITMWCPLIISMVLGILAILTSILGTTNPFFYTFANVPELYALETGGPFGGIKMAAILIVIGFGFTIAGAILSCLAELMDGYVEEVEENTEEIEETEAEPEKAEEPTEKVEKSVEVEEKGEESEEPVEETDEDGQYICPTFKDVYEALPSGYQIKKGDMKRDPEIKGMLHFRIGNHYFKTTASGDIYDDEPWA